MSDLLIVQNVTREQPGLLAQVLRSANVTFDVIDLDKGEDFPPLDDYKALVVLGGPDSANDNTPKMAKELERIKEALNAELPCLGICLGLQTLVKAAGGKVAKGEVKEIGFTDQNNNQNTVEVTSDGKRDQLLANLPDVLNVFQLHGETVELTPSMHLLATSKFCRNQIVKVAKNAYGIQSHFELTPEMLAVWAEQDPDLIPVGGDKLQSEFRTIEQAYTHIGQTLLQNFLRIAKLM